MLNDPILYTDPTGHQVCWEGSTPGNCLDAMGSIKKEIKDTYGITLSNKHKKWTLKNALLVFSSLGNIDKALHGNLKGVVNGATFMLDEHHPDADHPNSTYHGWTVGNTVTFYTTGNQTIRQMNVYHEFGHVLNNLPGRNNVFSNALDHLHEPSFVTDKGNGILDIGALESARVYDPNYGTAEAIQHECTCATEQWADIFANYVAGNIDLSKPGKGLDMYNFVTSVLYTAPVGAPLSINQ